MLVLVGLILVMVIWRMWPRHFLERMTDQKDQKDQQDAKGPIVASSSAAAPAIANGQPATYQSFPWYVSLYTGSQPGLHFRCGGVLVAPHLVLSAAHCPDPSWVWVGGATWIKVVKVVRRGQGQHPANDWMLVQLATRAPQTPVKIATKVPAHQTQMMVIGRGNKAVTGNEDRSLTTAWMMYMDNPIAMATMRHEKEEQHMIQRLKDPNAGFAMPSSSAICSGDSGGPIVVEKRSGTQKSYELVGLVSISNCLRGFLYFCKVAGRFRTTSGNGIALPP